MHGCRCVYKLFVIPTIVVTTPQSARSCEGEGEGGGEGGVRRISIMRMNVIVTLSTSRYTC